MILFGRTICTAYGISRQISLLPRKEFGDVYDHNRYDPVKTTTNTNTKMKTILITLLCVAIATATNCTFSIQDVGSLDDGQLRLGYGTGATNVTFTLSNGTLTSSLGLICYISAQTQLQCNTPPQTNAFTSFSVVDNQLAYDGSDSWWSCDAGTGGSNLYTTQFYSQCVAAVLTVTGDTCTTATTSSTTAATSAVVVSSSTVTPTTTTAASDTCFSIANTGSLCDGQLR